MITLPLVLDAARVAARLEHGVLTVPGPKAGKPQPVRVEGQTQARRATMRLPSHAPVRHADEPPRMITIVQRVLHASVRVDGQEVGACGRGCLLLVGVEKGDREGDADATAQKLARLRCFPGRTPMDLTLVDVGGGVLVVSQFTLAAELAEGNRPSFTDAEDPSNAERLYLRVSEQLRELGLQVATGRFGATMEVTLSNDGPVTFVLQAKNGRVQKRRPWPLA